MGTGCEKCAFTGFYGRTGIYELLIVNDEMRKLVLKGADSNQLREAAIRLGMKTLLQSGTEKIRDGITTLSEVLRVTQEA
jgi:type II secretory ATPase GspE/PulE/Tfp pilus assembly ATPase PilB-like protein